MLGLNNKTGTQISGIDHLRQSVCDILTTPIGSRVMRRDYGSRLFQLIDAPLNGTTIAEIYAATAEALERWEPRLKLLRVSLSAAASDGHVVLDVDGTHNGHQLQLRGVQL